MFEVWTEAKDRKSSVPRVTAAINLGELLRSYCEELPILTTDVKIIDSFGDVHDPPKDANERTFSTSRPFFVLFEDGGVAVADSVGLDSYVRQSEQILNSESFGAA